MNTPLMTKDRKLRSAGEIADILKKNGLRKLDLNIPRGKVMARYTVMLNKAEGDMPSTSAVLWLRQMTLSSKKLWRMHQEARRISLCNSRVNPPRICQCKSFWG